MVKNILKTNKKMKTVKKTIVLIATKLKNVRKRGKYRRQEAGEDDDDEEG